MTVFGPIFGVIALTAILIILFRVFKKRTFKKVKDYEAAMMSEAESDVESEMVALN